MNMHTAGYLARLEDVKEQMDSTITTTTTTGTDPYYLINQLDNQKPSYQKYLNPPDPRIGGYINNPYKNPGPFGNPAPYPNDPFEPHKNLDDLLKFRQQTTRERELQKGEQQAQQSLMDYIKGKQDLRTEFEKIIDSIFTNDEKVEYLLSIGYTSDTRVYFKDKAGVDWSLQPAFIKEMLIKFKNVLLAKSLIKIKLT